jgi:hypothetical protein
MVVNYAEKTCMIPHLLLVTVTNRLAQKLPLAAGIGTVIGYPECPLMSVSYQSGAPPKVVKIHGVTVAK